MAFCSNCGKELANGAKFCFECGSAVETTKNNTNKSENTSQEKIHLCPQCGAPIPSFSVACPNCGTEIHGKTVSSSAKEFYNKLSTTKVESDKIQLIKTFVIPNNKEDIFEFFLLASSNFDANYYSTHLNVEDVSDAWLTKIEQCYQKAELLFGGDRQFETIKRIYTNIKTTINIKVEENKITEKKKKRKSLFNEIAEFLPQIAICGGWLISLFVLVIFAGINLDSVGFNPSQIFLILDFILGAFLIPKMLNNDFLLLKIVTLGGLVLSLIIIIILSFVNTDNVGFNAYQLALIIGALSSVVIFIRTLRAK